MLSAFPGVALRPVRCSFNVSAVARSIVPPWAANPGKKMAEFARGSQHLEADARHYIGFCFLILTALSQNFTRSSRAQERPAGKVHFMGLSQSHQAQAPVRNPLKRSSITSSDILAWRRPGLPKSTLGGRPRGSAPLAKSLPISSSRITASRTLELPRELPAPPSVSTTTSREQVAIDALTATGTFRRNSGVQQLCAQTNPIKVDAGGTRANSNYAQSYFYTHGAAVVGSRC